MTETSVIICVALCMFLEGELVEHTYQSSMSECLKNKRIAERTVQPERVQLACGKDIIPRLSRMPSQGNLHFRDHVHQQFSLESLQPVPPHQFH